MASTSVTITDSSRFTYKDITPVEIVMKQTICCFLTWRVVAILKIIGYTTKKNSAGTDIEFNVFPVTTGNTVIEDSRYADPQHPISRYCKLSLDVPPEQTMQFEYTNSVLRKYKYLLKVIL